MLKSHVKFHSANGKRLLLVVDDEFINREILKNILLKDDYNEEYDLLLAQNGQEALDLIREYKDTLSLVLLDLQMPVMGGLQLLQIKKEDPLISSIPVIVTTSDQKAEVESLLLGASDFISKPYPPEDVIHARVKRAIELTEDRQIINSTERDPLTGLYNREYFYRYAEQFDLHHKDMKMDAIIIDINHFHMINERFGRSYGDEVLRNIGERVRQLVSENEGIVCRREADTFMVYCPGGQDYAQILQQAAIGLSEKDSSSNRVRLRMGVYADVDKSIDIERRFDRAKMAADTVRNSFAKTIGIYDNALHEKEIYAEQLIDDFRRAIAEKQFVVYYQPKFNIRTEIPVLSSAEALVRWVHPELGMISPGVFIPLFEDNGLIQELDDYVWRAAAGQIRDWKDRFGISVPVSVNVSRIDMYDPHLIDTLKDILQESRLQPSELLLEITESAYTQDSEQIVDTVNRLRELGFLVEMDDFGTGYSSLNMISRLPLDALKLDMQFIRQAFGQQQDTRMLEVIIDIAEYLHVPVIAEGVETEEQLKALKNMGCHIVQGYYFSKPVPPDEYESFIVARKEQQSKETPEEKRLQETPVSPEERMKGRIAHALSSGYESIYYVDPENGHYIQFGSGGRFEDLQIETGGEDFFADAVQMIEQRIYPEDRQRVRVYLDRSVLTGELVHGRSLTITYRMLVNGQPEYYNMKAISSGNEEDRRIVIGISNVNRRLTEEEKLEVERQSTVTFSNIAEALSQDYFSIYYVDTVNDHYIEYRSREEFRKLDIESGNEDFFNLIRRNIPKVVHPDDVDMFLSLFTKENILSELEQDKTFTLTYRLMMEEGPVYVHLKATRMEDRRDKHIVIGVSNVNDQILREQAYARAIRMANQDALTGVKSKHAYDEEEHRVDLEICGKTAEPFAVAVCDINGLKQVNDTYGHAAGDQFIKDACTVICNVFKHSPVYRIGGDEFAVILRYGDYEIRDELMKLLESKNRENEEKGRATIAGGLAVYQEDTDQTMASVFERADAAMYQKKKQMKNCSQQDK